MFVVDRARLTRREASLLTRLEAEYTPELVTDVLAPLVTQTCPVSLRCLDWAVTNWRCARSARHEEHTHTLTSHPVCRSKQHNVVCSSSVPGQVTNVHHAYRTALTFWTRKLFDPFRRRARIGVRLADGTVLDTTLGQANFALWCARLGHVVQRDTHTPTLFLAVSQVVPHGRPGLRPRPRGRHRGRHERRGAEAQEGAARGRAQGRAPQTHRADGIAALDVRRLPGAVARRVLSGRKFCFL